MVDQIGRWTFDDKIVCISGSRHYVDLDSVDGFVSLALSRARRVLIGDAAGVDRTTLLCCSANNIPHQVFRPDWKKHGKAAGPIRNREMVKAADVVVAFWDGRSRGTQSTIMAAKAHRKPCLVVQTAWIEPDAGNRPAAAGAVPATTPAPPDPEPSASPTPETPQGPTDDPATGDGG